MIRLAAGTLTRSARIPTALACAFLVACSQPAAKSVPEGTAAVIEANRRADAYFRSGNLDAAAQYYREAMRLARSIEDSDSIAANAVNLSIVYQRMGRPDRARTSLDVVREQDGKLVFPPYRLAQVALRRAVLDMDEQKFPKAAGWVEQAAGYCKNCPLSSGIHNVRAQLALEAGDVDAAAASARAGLSASRSSGDRAETANALRVLGLAAIRAGDPAAALGFLDEALVVDREIAVPRKIYLDLVALGRAKALSGDRNAALSYYERAFVVSDAGRDARGAAEARALIEAINERRDAGSPGAPAATMESHAGQ